MVGVCADDTTANATVKRMLVQDAWRWRLRRSAALLVILMAANEKINERMGDVRLSSVRHSTTSTFAHELARLTG